MVEGGRLLFAVLLVLDLDADGDLDRAPLADVEVEALACCGGGVGEEDFHAEALLVGDGRRLPVPGAPAAGDLGFLEDVLRRRGRGGLRSEAIVGQNLVDVGVGELGGGRLGGGGGCCAGGHWGSFAGLLGGALFRVFTRVLARPWQGLGGRDWWSGWWSGLRLRGRSGRPWRCGLFDHGVECRHGAAEVLGAEDALSVEGDEFRVCRHDALGLCSRYRGAGESSRELINYARCHASLTSVYNLQYVHL